ATFDASGSFTITTSLSLDASADGPHALRLRATDRDGHASVRQIDFTLDTNLVNRAVTADAGVQQMPSVAVDPLDPRHIVIAYMDYSVLTTGYAGIGIAASRDNGVTWQHSTAPLPVGFDQGASNPVAHFDAGGHLFVSYMAVTYLGPKAALTNPAGIYQDT